MPKKYEQIPAAPFADWLNKRLGQITADTEEGDLNGACVILASEVGWSNVSNAAGVRKLYRLRHQLKSGSRDKVKAERHTDTYARDVVEEALFMAGVPFEDLYPDLPVTDLELEPEQWCSTCEEISTPIGGFCPFCDAEIGPRTSQRLLGKRTA